MSNTNNEPYITVIIPAFNEISSLPELFKEITESMSGYHYAYEIIIINDGSSDGTREYLDELTGKNKIVKAIHLRKNSGQTAAMMAGIDHAKGDIIIAIDADLQNDPADIPLLLQKIDEGHDVVSGWRMHRKDNPLLRTLPSKIANTFIQLITGVRLHDYGCTLKAYRREIIKEIRLYGEMHRFIPIYAKQSGAKVTEVPVNHRVRTHGKSKYGLDRMVKVILDLMVILFFQAYFQRPIYVFGSFGLISFFLSFVTFATMLYYKYYGGKSFIETPLPLLATLFVLIGSLSIFMGFIAQMTMMTYYESQHRASYSVAYTRNLE
ncbi:MAG TPA: glycosyltransferase family 2 protein [Chitinispirillaceae bacterium]|nr:glycosyltransferase family 2 protein [Chitinispirillaceae bacterium]